MGDPEHLADVLGAKPELGPQPAPRSDVLGTETPQIHAEGGQKIERNPAVARLSPVLPAASPFSVRPC